MTPRALFLADLDERDVIAPGGLRAVPALAGDPDRADDEAEGSSSLLADPDERDVIAPALRERARRASCG